MKFLHTADWHIGRTLNGFSLKEEQRYAYEQIVALAKAEAVDGIVIAGDLYDRSIPPLSAVEQLNEMLEHLVVDEQIPVYAISGNHDSAKRLGFGQAFYPSHQLFLHTTLLQSIQPIETKEVQLYLLPFVDPSEIRIFCQHVLQETIEQVKEYRTLAQGITRIIEEMRQTFDPTKRQVLVTHFAVTKKEQTEHALTNWRTSETSSTVGGLASLTSDLFHDFSYVALGHIHTHFASPSKTVVYSGSPVHFDSQEAKKEACKGVYIVDVTQEGIKKNYHELDVKRPIITLEATFEQLCDREFYAQYPCGEAWFSIKLLAYDRRQLAGINIRSRLEEIYGTVIELTFEERVKNERKEDPTIGLKERAPEQTIQMFYETITKQVPSDYQRTVIEEVVNEVLKEK